MVRDRQTSIKCYMTDRGSPFPSTSGHTQPRPNRHSHSPSLSPPPSNIHPRRPNVPQPFPAHTLHSSEEEGTDLEDGKKASRRKGIDTYRLEKRKSRLEDEEGVEVYDGGDMRSPYKARTEGGGKGKRKVLILDDEDDEGKEEGNGRRASSELSDLPPTASGSKGSQFSQKKKSTVTRPDQSIISISDDTHSSTKDDGHIEGEDVDQIANDVDAEDGLAGVSSKSIGKGKGKAENVGTGQAAPDTRSQAKPAKSIIKTSPITPTSTTPAATGRVTRSRANPPASVATKTTKPITPPTTIPVGLTPPTPGTATKRKARFSLPNLEDPTTPTRAGRGGASAEAEDEDNEAVVDFPETPTKRARTATFGEKGKGKATDEGDELPRGSGLDLGSPVKLRTYGRRGRGGRGSRASGSGSGRRIEKDDEGQEMDVDDSNDGGITNNSQQPGPSDTPGAPSPSSPLSTHIRSLRTPTGPKPIYVESSDSDDPMNLGYKQRRRKAREEYENDGVVVLENEEEDEEDGDFEMELEELEPTPVSVASGSASGTGSKARGGSEEMEVDDETAVPDQEELDTPKAGEKKLIKGQAVKRTSKRASNHTPTLARRSALQPKSSFIDESDSDDEDDAGNGEYRASSEEEEAVMRTRSKAAVGDGAGKRRQSASSAVSAPNNGKGKFPVRPKAKPQTRRVSARKPQPDDMDVTSEEEEEAEPTPPPARSRSTAEKAVTQRPAREDPDEESDASPPPSKNKKSASKPVKKNGSSSKSGRKRRDDDISLTSDEESAPSQSQCSSAPSSDIESFENPTSSLNLRTRMTQTRIISSDEDEEQEQADEDRPGSDDSAVIARGSRQVKKPYVKKLEKGRKRDPDTESEGDTDPGELLKEIEMDGPTVVESRFRDRTKKTAYQKGLEKLKRKRNAPLIHVDHSDSEGAVSDSYADAGFIDVDDLPELDELEQAYSQTRVHDVDGDKEDEGEEEDDFIASDDEGYDSRMLPAQFRQVEDMEQQFKVVSQYLIYLIVEGPTAATLSQNHYFREPLTSLRRRLQGIKDSLVTSSIWKTHFKRSLEKWPEMAVEELEEGVEGCDACEKQMWSKFEAEMSGEVYDRDTFEDEDDESEYDEEGVSIKKGPYKMGKYCMKRAEVFHAFSHWEHTLYHDYKEPYDRLLRKVNAATATANANDHNDNNDGAGDDDDDVVEIAKPVMVAGFTRKTILEADRVLEYFERRGRVKQEWNILQGMMDEARNLEYKKGSRFG